MPIKYEEAKRVSTREDVKDCGKAKKKTKAVCDTMLIFDVTKCKKLQEGEPKDNVL